MNRRQLKTATEALSSLDVVLAFRKKISSGVPTAVGFATDDESFLVNGGTGTAAIRVALNAAELHLRKILDRLGVSMDNPKTSGGDG